MIIRTHKRPAAPVHPSARRVSTREAKRLQFTNRPEKKRVAVPEEKDIIIEEPMIEETVHIEEPAAVAEPIEELDETIVEPGTAIIRSKALEELENFYKKEPEKVPKKKYKVVSLGK